MTELNKVEARQAVETHRVRYILGISLSVTIVALFIVWLILR